MSKVFLDHYAFAVNDGEGKIIKHINGLYVLRDEAYDQIQTLTDRLDEAEKWLKCYRGYLLMSDMPTRAKRVDDWLNGAEGKQDE